MRGLAAQSPPLADDGGGGGGGSSGGEPPYVTGVAVLPADAAIAALSSTGSITLFSVAGATLMPVRTLGLPHPPPLPAVFATPPPPHTPTASLSPAPLLYVATADGTVLSGDPRTPRLAPFAATSDCTPLLSLAVSADGSRLAGGGHAGQLTIWDARRGGAPLSETAELHDGHVMALAFEPDGVHNGGVGGGVSGNPTGDASRLATAAEDGLLCVLRAGDLVAATADGLPPAAEADDTLVVANVGSAVDAVGWAPPPPPPRAVTARGVEAADRRSPRVWAVTATCGVGVYSARSGRTVGGTPDARVSLSQAVATGETPHATGCAAAPTVEGVVGCVVAPAARRLYVVGWTTGGGVVTGHVRHCRGAREGGKGVAVAAPKVLWGKATEGDDVVVRAAAYGEGLGLVTGGEDGVVRLWR
ncbi:hypothetical protein MMPV_002805 [Pyropia vietnamensis]